MKHGEYAKCFIHCPAQHAYGVGQGLPPLLPELAKMSGFCFRRSRVGLGVVGCYLPISLVYGVCFLVRSES